MKEPIELGDEVIDLVTRERGIAVAETEWLNGCIRYQVQPQGRTKDDKLHEVFSADEQQLEVVKKAVVPRPARLRSQAQVEANQDRAYRTGGGGRPEPTRQSI